MRRIATCLDVNADTRLVSGTSSRYIPYPFLDEMNAAALGTPKSEVHLWWAPFIDNYRQIAT